MDPVRDKEFSGDKVGPDSRLYNAFNVHGQPGGPQTQGQPVRRMMYGGNTQRVHVDI